MVKRLERFAAANAALAIELPKVFFGLGIDGKPGVSFRFVLLDQLADSLELSVAIGMFAAGNIFANLPKTNPGFIKPCGNRVAANRSAHRIETLGQTAR